MIPGTPARSDCSSRITLDFSGVVAEALVIRGQLFLEADDIGHAIQDSLGRELDANVTEAADGLRALELLEERTFDLLIP
jgi:hypothetical protein